MKEYITIDGGTTNTRVSLTDGKSVRATVKIPIGARKSIDGSAELKAGLREAIKKLLSDTKICISDLDAIIASGMITSEFGLINLPHLTAPVGLEELHGGIFAEEIPEVVSLPIHFIRGVKTVGTLASTDMMRGEETELIGILDSSYGECVYVLPGSHSKLIYTDGDGRITHFSTTLTGEMLAALSEGTILRDAVSLSVEKLDTDSLESGFLYAKEHGINEALFKTRILKNLFGKDESACYSFFLGAVLSDEILSIVASAASTAVIGGKRQLKEATAHLLSKFSDKKTVILSDEVVESSTALGAVKIFEYVI